MRWARTFLRRLSRSRRRQRSLGFRAPRHCSGCQALRRVVAVFIVTVIGAATEPARAQSAGLPEGYSGIWVEGECQSASRVRILNDLAIIDFLSIRGEPHLQIVGIKSARMTGSVVTVTLSTSTGETLQNELSLDGRRLNGTFNRCDQPPPVVAWTLGEVVALFEAAGRIQRLCAAGDSQRCLRAAFEAIDVSRDGVLRPAEVARLLRVLGFVVGYAAAERPIVPAKDLVVPTAIGGMLAPTIAGGFVDNYDYDGDGGLSLDELIQDRGDLAGLMAVMGGAEPVAAEMTVQAVVEMLKNFFGQFGNLGWLR